MATCMECHSLSSKGRLWDRQCHEFWDTFLMVMLFSRECRHQGANGKAAHGGKILFNATDMEAVRSVPFHTHRCIWWDLFSHSISSCSHPSPKQSQFYCFCHRSSNYLPDPSTLPLKSSPSCIDTAIPPLQNFFFFARNIFALEFLVCVGRGVQFTLNSCQSGNPLSCLAGHFLTIQCFKEEMKP